jgi:hypothetical protein
VHVHPQQSARLGAGERRLGLLDVAEDGKAALVISLAVKRGADLPRRTLQEADAEARLQLLDAVGRRRARQPEVLGGERKAAPFHDAGEQAHGVDPVHDLTVPDFRIVLPNQNRLFET